MGIDERENEALDVLDQIPEDWEAFGVRAPLYLFIESEFRRREGLVPFADDYL